MMYRKRVLTSEETKRRKSESNRIYRQTHPEVAAAYNKRWYENKKKRWAAMTEEEKSKFHKDRYKGPYGKAYYQKYQYAMKLEMLRAYGLWCACCGENEPVFLTLDHINGDGAKQRRLNHRGGYAKYLELKRDGWPPGYQVLCFNCNIAKRQNIACPHRSLFDRLTSRAIAEEAVVVLQP